MPNNDNVSNNKTTDLHAAGAVQQSKSASPQSDQPAALAGGKTARAAYLKPELHVYGAVHHITGGLAGSGTDAQGMFMDMTMSDCTTKQDIVRIGTHPAGFGLYLFNYKPEHRQYDCAMPQRAASAFRHFGVMAQEVQRRIPAAVSVSAAGYLQVDYARLGVALAPPPARGTA